MPYIEETLRQKYLNILKQLPDIETKGDLEYCVFVLMLKYMKTRELRYTQLHDCTYAVMHCADEFRRRFLDGREDVAKDKNGDISV